MTGVQTCALPISGLDVTRQAVQALAYVAVAIAGLGLVGFFTVAIPVQILLLVVTVIVCWRVLVVAPAFDLAMWRRLAVASITFSLAIAVSVTYQYTAQIITAAVSTNVEAGLFAAGDVRATPFRQIVTACSDGAVAAHSASQYIDELHGESYR